MRWLTDDRRRLLLVGTGAALAGIFIAAPDYLAAQGAGDAATFRSIVEPEPGRYAVAAGFDILFALGYGASAVAYLRRVRRARPGLVVFTLGALADVVENVLLLVNSASVNTVTDGAVEAVVTTARIKWALLVIGGLYVVVALAFARRRR